MTVLHMYHIVGSTESLFISVCITIPDKTDGKRTKIAIWLRIIGLEMLLGLSVFRGIIIIRIKYHIFGNYRGITNLGNYYQHGNITIPIYLKVWFRNSSTNTSYLTYLGGKWCYTNNSNNKPSWQKLQTNIILRTGHVNIRVPSLVVIVLNHREGQSLLEIK